MRGTGMGTGRARRWWPAAAALIGLIAVAGCKGGTTGAAGPSGTASAGGPPASPPAASSPAASSGTAGPAGTAGAVSPSNAGLCASIPAVIRADIIKLLPIDKVPGQAPAATPNPPGEVTITDPAVARGLAQAACALPVMPSGTYHCPLDHGGAVELIFAAASETFPQVVAGTSGCETVRGLGPDRWAVNAPGFWTALVQAAPGLGITHSA